jgi:hypothetical protein
MLDYFSPRYQGRIVVRSGRPGVCFSGSWTSMRRISMTGLLSFALLVIALVSVCPSANAQDPSVVGQFSPLMEWYYNPTHAVLLPSGSVLWWPSFLNGDTPRIWNPATNVITHVPPAGYNIFCAGHTILPGGQVLITGGDAAIALIGVPNASILDPVAETWTYLPNMNEGRFYPTNTVLANGNVLVTSGEISPADGNDPLPQVWQLSSSSWQDLTTAQLLLPNYPEMYLTPTGTVFYAGPSTPSEYLDTTGTGAWTIGPNLNFAPRDYGPSVMYNNGQIMAVGGGGVPTPTAEIINLNSANPTWSYTGSMANPRRQNNATVLPDGTVLVSGGSSGTGFDDNTNPVYPDELWNPTTGTWTTLASLSVYRGYHSVAILLPDGRVLSGGGECSGVNCDKSTAEIFSPPYLFQGPRPTITSAPTYLEGGSTFFVGTPNAANITGVTLLRLGAVTHTFNMEQRFSFLNYTQATGGLNVTLPPSANLTPPGFYMLFLLMNGVPSVSSIIQLDDSTFATNPPAVSVSQTSLTYYGNTAVGTPTASKSIQLTNLGTAPVTINSITTGTDYQITGNTCGTQLAPGSCTINVAFQPTTSGPLKEFLTFNDSDPSSPQTVALSGTGKAFKIGASLVNFGNHAVGTTSTAIPVTLTNTGTGPINIAGINFTNSEFAQQANSTCGASIPGLSSCQVFTTFTPNASGTQTGSFVVTDSDPSSPTTVNFTGVGLAFTVSPGYLSFGNINIPKTSPAGTFTLKNIGSSAITFSGMTFGGTNPGDFAISNNTCGTSLAGNSSCTLQVTFTPQASGARSATLTLTDSDPSSPQVLPLAGHGVPVLTSIAVAPAASTITVGSTQQFTATGTYSDGSTNNVTSTAVWSSNNSNVASIVAGGLATGSSAGTATITATVSPIIGSTPLTVQNNTASAVTAAHGSNTNETSTTSVASSETVN